MLFKEKIMKIKYVIVIMFLFAVFACKKNGLPDKPKPKPTPTEKAKLKSINVGTYGLSEKDLEDALKDAGFTREFDVDFPKKNTITYMVEEGATAQFIEGGAQITLTDVVQTIKIKVSGKNKLDSTYTLHLSRKKENIAVLTSLSVGTYALSKGELQDALDDAGFTREFDVDFPKDANITYVAEEGATTQFIEGGAQITLTDVAQTVKIKVSATNKLDSTYTLHLSRKKEVPVKLTSLSVGTHDLSDEELEDALKDAGFTHEFGLYFPADANITYVAEEGATAQFIEGDAQITLTDVAQTIKIKVSAKNKLDSTYTLHLSKKQRAPENIAIEPKRVLLAKAETLQLTINATPEDASKNVTWESNDSAVKVENGLITAIDNGVAVITATSKKDTTKKATCIVQVGVKIEKIELSKYAVELFVGESVSLSATVTPNEAPQNVIWETYNNEFFSVTAGGVITAKNKLGQGIVRAVSTADSTKFAECAVYVVADKVSRVSVQPSALSMSINATKDVRITISPDSAPSEIEYEIEGENLTIEKLEKQNSGNEYICTIKSGSIEETKNITFYSKVNKNKKAIVSVTTEKYKPSSVVVNDKTISLDQVDQKMTARVLPEGCEQGLTWKSENPNIVAINASTGLLTPLTVGRAKIIATSTEDSTIKGEGYCTVKAGLRGFSVKSFENGKNIWGGKKGDREDALIELKCDPEDAFGDFVFECKNEDLEFIKDANNHNKFSVRVKNEKAKAASRVRFSVSSKVNPSLPKIERYVNIQTRVPRLIEIEGGDGICFDETSIKFKTKKSDASPRTYNWVKWELEKSYSYDPAPIENFSITNNDSNYENAISECTLKIVGSEETKKALVNKKIVLVAKSIYNDSVVARKTITIFKKIAEIRSVSIKEDITDYVLASYRNRQYYNPKTVSNYLNLILELDVTDEEELALLHPYCYITDTFSFNDNTPLEDIKITEFDKQKYEVEYDEIDKTISIRIQPTKNTKCKRKNFFIFPVDPKTGRPSKKSYDQFRLAIWEEPKGMELRKTNEDGNFDIHKADSGYYYTDELGYGTNGRNFDLYITPKYAYPHFLKFDVVRVNGRYTCIVNPQGTQKTDSEGVIYWHFTFDLNSNNSIGKADVADLNFRIKKEDDSSPTPKVENFLRVTSN